MPEQNDLASSPGLAPDGLLAEHGIDLVSLQCFVAVAQQLSFSRAAVALHITQPALSRRIRQLEQRLGVPLLVRTTRSVTLTRAGEALLPAALDVAASVGRAIRQTRVAGQPVVTIGFTAGLSTNRAVRLFRSYWPGVSVQRRRVEWNDQSAAVASGRVDLCVGRHPVDGDGFNITPLYTEARLVMLSADHRFAHKESLSIDDLANEPMVRHRNAATWDAFWRIDPRPDGRPAPDGPLAVSVEEKLEIVASGEAVALLPMSAAAQYIRPDIVGIPLRDVTPAVVVAISRAPSTPVITGLLEAVIATLGQHSAECPEEQKARS